MCIVHWLYLKPCAWSISSAPHGPHPPHRGPHLVTPVQFPFFVLLISHQHCLLALATAIDQYKLLDISVDDFPGDAPDKCARCLKLHHLPGMRDMAGGVCGSWSAKGWRESPTCSSGRALLQWQKNILGWRQYTLLQGCVLMGSWLLGVGWWGGGHVVGRAGGHVGGGEVDPPNGSFRLMELHYRQE